MKNFLRIVMFLIIAAAVAGTTIFLTNQNDNYITDESDNITSGDIEDVADNTDNTDSTVLSGEISGDIFSGELIASGEDSEIDANESGENLETSGDEAEVILETVSGEIIDEVLGEVSGDVSSEINKEEQVV